jgi:hypothetical protein
MTRKVTVSLAKNGYFCLYTISEHQSNEVLNEEKGAFENVNSAYWYVTYCEMENLTALALDKCQHQYVDM